MSSKYNSSYMAICSLTYISSFSVNFFFQPINTNFAYFEKKTVLKSSVLKLELQLSLIQDGCHYYWQKFQIAKKESPEIFMCNLEIKLKTR
jgi:hypothetical protein